MTHLEMHTLVNIPQPQVKNTSSLTLVVGHVYPLSTSVR